EVQARIRTEFEGVAALFNFKMMEPAPIEHLAILRAKSGSDVDKEIYAFKDKGGRDVGLRFDLTVGMTRYVCARRDLRPPVKLAALAGVWRYDEPQHARYRWFAQWDLEIFGPRSVQADADVIEATYRLFQRLGIKFSIKVGDREAVQAFVNKSLGVVDPDSAVDLMRALDKTSKRTLQELKKEYGAKGFKEKTLTELFEFGRLSGEPDKVLAELEARKVSAGSLAELRDALKERGLGSISYNMGVVRGIDYYTGVVFEVTDEKNPDLGSLAGGGRYDLLPSTFGRPELSATGAAGGMDRTALSLGAEGKAQSRLVYVAFAGDAARPAAMKALAEIRSAGVPAETSFTSRPLAKQIEDASRLGAAWAVIVGTKEVGAGTVTLRDMQKRSEAELPLEKALETVRRSR
ncbi:MAG TPA: histidine--tRNA ligase, partial [Nitrososphaerales archaeon]|nr:histidine--tRNA ligase [Nitrososphaerales archaeon]